MENNGNDCGTIRQFIQRCSECFCHLLRVSKLLHLSKLSLLLSHHYIIVLNGMSIIYFSTCRKSQLIDLEKEGYNTTFMDHLQPDIKICDWWGRFIHCVELLYHCNSWQINYHFLYMCAFGWLCVWSHVCVFMFAIGFIELSLVHPVFIQGLLQLGKSAVNIQSALSCLIREWGQCWHLLLIQYSMREEMILGHLNR